MEKKIVDMGMKLHIANPQHHFYGYPVAVEVVAQESITVVTEGGQRMIVGKSDLSDDPPARRNLLPCFS